MNTARLKYLDIASGIMIIWLLLFHAVYPMIGENICGKIPYLYFFMPWFFYKSGMMFNPMSGRELIRKDSKKLLKTFLIWSAIGYVCYILWHYFFFKDLTLRLALYRPIRSFILGASIPMNGALWFLPILFCVRQISNYLLKRIHPLLIALIFLGLYSLMLVIDYQYTLQWISGTLWGIIAFTFAYHFKNRINPIRVGKYLVTVAFVVYVASLFTDVPSVYTNGDVSIFSKIIWPIVCAFSCVAFNSVCIFLERITSNMFGDKSFPLLRYVGRHSMTYYVGHYIIFCITFDSISVIKPEWYSTWQGLAITFIAYGLILTAICILSKH